MREVISAGLSEDVIMSDYTVTLTISEAIYTRARQFADNTAQPVERVLTNSLEQAFDADSNLPPDEQAELAALSSLSDDTLWTIAADRTPPTQQERLSLLLVLNKRGVLSDAEQVELDNLLERGDKMTLRKAEAALILIRRGHRVDMKALQASRG